MRKTIAIDVGDYFRVKYIIKHNQRRGRYCYPRIVNNELCLIISDKDMTTENL